MIDPVTGMAIAQGVTSIVKWLGGRDKRKFANTAYAKRLQEIMKQGKYSPAAESRIIGGVSKSAGNIAQRASANYRGRLESAGMGRSIAGQRGLSEIQTRPIEAVTRTRERIATEDELAKEAAKNEYAIAKTSYRERLDELNRRNNVNLIGGLANAGAGYLVGKSQQAAFEKYKAGNPEAWAATQANPMQSLGQAAGIGYKQMLTNRYNRINKSSTLPDFKTASDIELMNWTKGAKTPEEYDYRLYLLMQSGRILQQNFYNNEGAAR